MTVVTRKNIQYSLRRARPRHTAYCRKTSRYQLTVALPSSFGPMELSAPDLEALPMDFAHIMAPAALDLLQ
jgi:hypothetical protein